MRKGLNVRLFCGFAAVLVGGVAMVAAGPPVPTGGYASVERLKLEAFQALKVGQFDRSDQLLHQAASLSDDPTLRRMSAWTRQFESQRQTFVNERRRQFDKAVGDVHKLISAGKEGFAVDAAARAYLLADDKKAFRHEPWVDDLIKSTIALAADFERQEQWLKALRLYSDLGSIEPANSEWKERLKTATRRIRLLALYTPDDLKDLQKSEAAEREQADAILHPATQPATTKAAKDDGPIENFKIDWRETLRGIQIGMLTEALIDARQNYYRQVGYRDLLLGGIKGLKVLATTRGLEKTFSGLGSATQRDAFIAGLDQLTDEIRGWAPGMTRDDVATGIVRNRLTALNNSTVRIDEEVLVSEFADGAFAELDPFSSMIWPNDLEEFNKTTQGEFSGVGIQIQSDEDGSLKVVSPLEDSPAYRAGIKAGDIITHIDGKSAKGITLNQAVRTITGPSGTKVLLTVRSPDHTVRDCPIRRETIKVASIKGWIHRPGGGWDYFVDPDNGIGYIRLTNFTKTTSEDLNAAVDEMTRQGAKAMILDLRYNPGGLLTAATEVADKFLSRGIIVSTRADRETLTTPTITTAKKDNEETTMPVVVLVNQYSASASEIVSGALKDHHRALIVGERTFGKGSVQMLFPLVNRASYLKLTTSHYYLPGGRCIHREENSQEWGVDPDVTVEMTPEQMRTAIDARQDLDILRDLPPADRAAAAASTTRKDPLACDPQLSAALLLLRMKLAGAQL